LNPFCGNTSARRQGGLLKNLSLSWNQLRAPNKTSIPAALVPFIELRVRRLGFLQDGDVGVATGRFYESRELQIKGVNFLRAHVAQHQRGIIRG
jgi:hypothetical protein